MALALSGRFSSTVTTPSARATLSVSKFGVMLVSSLLGAKYLLDVRVEHRGAGQVLATVADNDATGNVGRQGRGEKCRRLADVIDRAQATKRNTFNERRCLCRIHQPLH